MVHIWFGLFALQKIITIARCFKPDSRIVLMKAVLLGNDPLIVDK